MRRFAANVTIRGPAGATMDVPCEFGENKALSFQAESIAKAFDVVAGALRRQFQEPNDLGITVVALNVYEVTSASSSDHPSGSSQR